MAQSNAHRSAVLVVVRPHVAADIDSTCRRLGIAASRLIELLVERHADRIDRDAAAEFVQVRELTAQARLHDERVRL